MARLTAFILAFGLLFAGASAGRTAGYASVVEAAADTEALSTLVTAVSAANLVGALGDEFKGTVFAPVNTAFNALPDGTLAALLAAPEGALTDILLYHVSAEISPSVSFFARGKEVKTLEGSSLTLSKSGKDLMVKGAGNAEPAKVLATVKAGKAIVYVIDAVLLP